MLLQVEQQNIWFNKRKSWEPLCTKINYYEHEETFPSFLPRNSPVGRKHYFEARIVSRNARWEQSPPSLFLFFSFHHLSVFISRDRLPSSCYCICIFLIFIPRGYFPLRFLTPISHLHLVSPRLLHGIITEKYRINQYKARWHFKERVWQFLSFAMVSTHTTPSVWSSYTCT
jgi:hypothetical protein